MAVLARADDVRDLHLLAADLACHITKDAETADDAKRLCRDRCGRRAAGGCTGSRLCRLALATAGQQQQAGNCAGQRQATPG